MVTCTRTPFLVRPAIAHSSHAASSYRLSRPPIRSLARPSRPAFHSTTISYHRLHTMAQPITLTMPATGTKISVPTGLFINNEFVPSVDSRETIEYVRSEARPIGSC